MNWRKMTSKQKQRDYTSLANVRNIFCDLNDLVDETSIQTCFVNPLLVYLGYPKDKICTKESIEKLPISIGSKTEKYAPDYVLLDSHNRPIIVLEVKNTNEDIRKWIYQLLGYASAVNHKYPPKEWPVQYAILTNGYMFEVYPWDSEIHLFRLNFRDFVARNELFAALCASLSFDNILNRMPNRSLKLHCPVCGSPDIENARYGSVFPRFRCKKHGHVFT
jgi:type I site-specific restriction endonuclease